MSGPGARLVSAGSILALTLLVGCVPATPDDDTYRDKTSVTLGEALSEVATVRTLLQTLRGEKMFRPTAIAQLRASQSTLDASTGAFNEVHPPPDLDALYQRSNTLLSQANDGVRAAALAVERNQVGRYSSLSDQLGAVAARLDELQGELP